MPKKQKTANSDSPQKSIEKALMENFVATQKVMVNLSGKLDNLATQISKLLELFEISAKALAEKNFQISESKDSKKVIEKIDSLLEQNKLIARGLTLMHEMAPKEPPQRYIPPHEYPMPRQRISSNPVPAKAPVEEGMTGYQRSITTQESAGNFESPVQNSEKKFGKSS